MLLIYHTYLKKLLDESSKIYCAETIKFVMNSVIVTFFVQNLDAWEDKIEKVKANYFYQLFGAFSGRGLQDSLPK